MVDNNETPEERLKKAHEKFDQNYLDFKNKKLAETPCLRSTFLTSKFLLSFYSFDYKNILADI